jgi:hypothetical protein
MLFLSEQRIHIGVNRQAGEKQRHGVIWANETVGGVVTSVRLPIIIDKPRLACEGMNYATWKRVKRQIVKMGIDATHIELKFDPQAFPEGGHFCYKLDAYKELYNARNTGQPLSRVGFA